MKRIAYLIPLMLLTACGAATEPDAYGTFEAEEVIVSAEANGKMLYFNVAEGEVLKANSVVGAIDSMQLFYQRQHLLAQQASLLKSRPDTEKRVAAIKQQIAAQQQKQ